MGTVANPILPATEVVRGLSSSEARQRLQKYGVNDPAPRSRGPLFLELLHLLFNPLVIILLIAGTISGILGDRIDALIIFVMMLLSVLIDFFQTYRSRRAIEQLRKQVSSTATALRDGTWQEIDRLGIVPCDIVRLGAGDLVPADAQLLEARDMYVQQGALTGESLPVEKHARSQTVENTDVLSSSEVFLGTSVVSGTGIAQVIATGQQTSFGAIAERLADRPVQTEFELSIRRFGLLITRTILFLVLFILLVRLAFAQRCL